MEGKKIMISSGEGQHGTVEEYTGKKTERALNMRLKKERANGDRWAKAWIQCGTNGVYSNFENPSDMVTF